MQRMIMTSKNLMAAIKIKMIKSMDLMNYMELSCICPMEIGQRLQRLLEVRELWMVILKHSNPMLDSRIYVVEFAD